ncbi:MAG TPA: hypothetical protein VMY42_00430 [Thermoguttaceae bacterium]|nr:hypothetical protein [Thermoguttaceae bacterium]
MLTNDEAITVGVRKYRELYPEGTLPLALEEAGVLGATPGKLATTIHVTFSIEGETEPFYLFRASVNRASGEVTIEDAADWRYLQGKQLDSSQSL